MWSTPRTAAAVLALVAAACGGADTSSEPGPAATEPDATEPVTSEPATTEPVTSEPVTSEPVTSEPVDAGRVVVLAEEWLLADVLALGIPVVASSATVPTAGFQGMDEFDTSGIELFDYLNVSLEEFATYRADTVIVGEFVVDYLGDEQVAGIDGDLVVVPDGSTGPERLRLLGDAFGRTEQAEALLAELDAAYAAAQPVVPDGCDVSVVAVYAGPNVAVFAEPVWDVPRAVDRLGCRLVPGAGEVDTDANGRALLSLEQLGLVSGSTILMMQTDTVEGERDSIAEIQDGPLWSQLPAVAGGDVVELDRLGYPGIAGELRLVDELVEVLGG